jgi:hypothetical protein
MRPTAIVARDGDAIVAVSVLTTREKAQTLVARLRAIDSPCIFRFDVQAVVEAEDLECEVRNFVQESAED